MCVTCALHSFLQSIADNNFDATGASSAACDDVNIPIAKGLSQEGDAGAGDNFKISLATDYMYLVAATISKFLPWSPTVIRPQK